MKRYIAEHNINFYTINATKLAVDIGLGGRINMIMQSAFFKLSEVLPLDEAVSHLKKSIVAEYGSKGEDIVNMNYEAVDAGISNLNKVEIKDSWKNATEDKIEENNDRPDFIKNVLDPMVRQEGDDLPVSTFVGREDGSFPHGTSAYEKRGIAVEVPHWIKENCIQCNQCAFVCPHAVVRPFLLDDEEKKNAPETFETIKATGKGFEEVEFRIQISALDCTGCGNCADVCPAKEKALVMTPFEEEYEEQAKNWEFAMTIDPKTDMMDKFSIKGSQFQEPLLEFSGACAGCGETPYAKLVTQMFGDRMMISNATGCSSIWGGSAPSTPYCKNKEGRGPSWANSLFEDNAEYGYGMHIAVKQMRDKLEDLMKEFIELNADEELVGHFNDWIAGKNDATASKAATGMILTRLNKDVKDERAKEILGEIEELKDYLIKRSMWIFGGDGWAYDIGFGGLDHVLASGDDVNVLVFDTEVYSNTGGQSSKATPTAAVAKFAASGKKVTKKNLGLMMTTYGYVYVAQVAMGANMNQLTRALKEAESYNGPSLVIAYSPCINHGIRAGMGVSIKQEKKAVDTGYWHLYRFDPRLKDEGKNPFVLDSKEPKEPFMDFINSEVRYTSLRKTFPEIADELFKAAEQDAKDKYEQYKKLAE